MAILYVVATPIGNLEDVSKRALEALSRVSLILAEDTRVTAKLLARYQIKTKLMSYHQHSRFARIDEIIRLLKGGQDLALVCDAGTPGVSDPGNLLIEKAIKALGDRVRVVPIPGPSAVTAAISVSGLPTDKFSFLGFLPRKKGRQTAFKKISQSEITIIFYESPHRILKTIHELFLLVPNKRIVVAQELTKKFEKIWRGRVADVLTAMKNQDLRGEFVVAIEGKSRDKNENQ